MYKVFLVEDEITTREGIRDNVDWKSMGFELSGEAPDGEIALPQIEAIQPDLLITDIKMPFMDGLQLCKIIREHMPWMKIVIISGYNDFQYAQSAIKLGVSDYLLKPVSVHDLHSVLAKVSVVLDQEKSERTYLKRLRSQVEDNLSLLREKFLLRLVTGGESSISAIEQSQQLGLNILAPCYLVILLEARPAKNDQVLDYAACQQVEKAITGLIHSNTDILAASKDMDEYLLVLKGENPEQVQQESAFLVKLFQEEVEKKTSCILSAGAGAPQQRLGELHQSFTEALANLKSAQSEVELDDQKKLNHAALRLFLDTGQLEEFDLFYDQQIFPLVEVALRSTLLKYYTLLDIKLAASQFISDLGGDPNLVLAGICREEDLTSLATPAEMRSEIHKLFSAAFAFRDSQKKSDRASIILQAKKYISTHFSDPDLSLNEVAARINFSPNHFSAVFSVETGETFRDYLARKRVEHAKKLLSTTRLKCGEIAFQCGYNDSHYFSIIFRKNCGMTPQQFRDSSQP